MCGRAYHDLTDEELEMRDFNRRPIRLNFEPNPNLAPTEEIPTLFFDKESEEFKTELGYWWLMPPWLNNINPRKAGSTFNSRGETLFEKKSFKGAAKYRRCEVVLSGFIEWQYIDSKQKQPYLIKRADGKPITMAAIYNECENRKTISIVTVAANKLMSEIHNRWQFDNKKQPRMPLCLVGDDRQDWHDSKLEDEEKLSSLIDSYLKSDRVKIEAFRIDKAVGNSRVKDVNFLESVDGEIFSN